MTEGARAVGEGLLGIGAFAARALLSREALRLYDRLGVPRGRLGGELGFRIGCRAPRGTGAGREPSRLGRRLVERALPVVRVRWSDKGQGEPLTP